MIKQKKGQIEIVLFLIFLLIIGTYVYFVISNYTSKRSECKEDCENNYNATFVDYESPGYKNEECWCRRGIKPLRIW